MLTVNGRLIPWGMGNYGGIFPSFEIKALGFPVNYAVNTVELNWEPEHGDREVLYLWYVMSYIKDKAPDARNTLILDYIPNARLDKKLGEDLDHGDELLPLNLYTASFINTLGFDKIIGVEPHSDEFLRCYKNAFAVYPTLDAISLVSDYLGKAKDDKWYQKIFPDIGSYERYRDFIVDNDFAIINKKRKDGRIADIGLGDGTISLDRDILIIDDICSRGSTAYKGAQLLKDLGAKGHIYLLVAHLEECVAVARPSLLDDDAPVDHIFVCANSMKHINHAKVTYLVPTYHTGDVF